MKQKSNEVCVRYDTDYAIMNTSIGQVSVGTTERRGAVAREGTCECLHLRLEGKGRKLGEGPENEERLNGLRRST